MSLPVRRWAQVAQCWENNSGVSYQGAAKALENEGALDETRTVVQNAQMSESPNSGTWAAMFVHHGSWALTLAAAARWLSVVVAKGSGAPLSDAVNWHGGCVGPKETSLTFRTYWPTPGGSENWAATGVTEVS